MRIHKLIILLIGMYSLTTGCVSISQVERVSAAGIAYASAMDSLIKVSQETSVDADSIRLLGQRGRTPTQRQTVYDNHSGVAKTVEILGEFRKHTRLLQNYFKALKALATTDAPVRAQNATQGAAAALGELGTQLGRADMIPTAEQQALGQLTGLAISAVQRGMIADELREHADLINQQLRIHVALTKALAGKLIADRKSAAYLGAQREVEAPFVNGPLKKEDNWIKRRRHYLILGSGLGSIAEASSAAEKLQKAWVAVVERKFDEMAFQDLLKDTAALVAIAENAKNLQ